MFPEFKRPHQMRMRDMSNQREFAPEAFETRSVQFQKRDGNFERDNHSRRPMASFEDDRRVASSKFLEKLIGPVVFRLVGGTGHGQRSNIAVERTSRGRGQIPCAAIVSILSSFMTLEPGDLIVTGT